MPFPSDLKKEAKDILEDPGLTTTEAIRMFLSQVRLRKGLPFPSPPTDHDDLLTDHSKRQAALDSVYDDPPHPIARMRQALGTAVFAVGIGVTFFSLIFIRWRASAGGIARTPGESEPAKSLTIPAGALPCDLGIEGCSRQA
ncbi:type II toxin-antitoxin system RelB/DinJ family antitoxin [Haloferula sargassicola]|uniref:type II toxin-antitoxin system RelB/DinJ family antitoxin n=1 Tax=Haloferula sargassicola TaxID=490096 RepID=UPI003365A553